MYGGKNSFQRQAQNAAFFQSFFLAISTCVWAAGESAEYLGWAEMRVRDHRMDGVRKLSDTERFGGSW